MVTSSQYERLTQPPKGSFFLFGVRGVGKSTWARDGIEVWPLRTFLEAIADEKLWP